MNDHTQSVRLYFRNVHFIGSFQNLQHILEVNVVLQIVFAKCLQTVIGESIKTGRLEQVQRIFRWHFLVTVVDVS